MNVYRNRLLNVAKALRESPRPDKFDMGHYAIPLCRTPACALGHYAARADLQKTFSLSFRGFLKARGSRVSFLDSSVLLHFGISQLEAHLLFGRHGCRDAQTALEAADYIEEFVAKKWPLEPGFEKLKAALTAT